ncbi:unnamed protein product [Moneuplotes crassus]|uniref:Uncharacterized protein n=1 Tax=Euplotes crassus TaxID=5936 RepID=A0AAD1UQA0_EUPCR|nr:unnamed protein product [Moneuplotes crassus]
MKYTCFPPDIVSHLKGSFEISYTEVPSFERNYYNRGKMDSVEGLSKEFGIQAFVLGLTFVVRLFTLLLSNGYQFNTTKKVGYIKKVLALAWLRYLMIIIDQQKEVEYEIDPDSYFGRFYPTQDLTWYILLICGIMESMSLLDMFNNTQIPFLANSTEIVQRENGVVRYSNEEHEFIDNFNFFDMVALTLNALFLYFSLDLYFNQGFGSFYPEELRIYCCFEICLMTMSLLLKPYETVRFPKMVTMIIPVIVFSISIYKLIELFRLTNSDNSFILFIIEFILLIQGRGSIYLASFIMFFFVKSYVIIYLTHKEKADDLDQIEEEQRKIIEERRRMIEERLKKHEERQALMIHSRLDNSGGLQGFEGISLFKDISCVYTCIAEEFYRIKANGDIIKENLTEFVKLSTVQSVSFIKKQFFNF